MRSFHDDARLESSSVLYHPDGFYTPSVLFDRYSLLHPRLCIYELPHLSSPNVSLHSSVFPSLFFFFFSFFVCSPCSGVSMIHPASCIATGFLLFAVFRFVFFLLLPSYSSMFPNIIPLSLPHCPSSSSHHLVGVIYIPSLDAVSFRFRLVPAFCSPSFPPLLPSSYVVHSLFQHFFFFIDVQTEGSQPVNGVCCPRTG